MVIPISQQQADLYRQYLLDQQKQQYAQQGQQNIQNVGAGNSIQSQGILGDLLLGATSPIRSLLGMGSKLVGSVADIGKKFLETGDLTRALAESTPIQQQQTSIAGIPTLTASENKVLSERPIDYGVGNALNTMAWAIPSGGGTSILGKTIKGAVQGTGMGGLSGLGAGLQEDVENPNIGNVLKRGLEGAGSGLLFGGGTGLVSGIGGKIVGKTKAGTTGGISKITSETPLAELPALGTYKPTKATNIRGGNIGTNVINAKTVLGKKATQAKVLGILEETGWKPTAKWNPLEDVNVGIENAKTIYQEKFSSELAPQPVQVQQGVTNMVKTLEDKFTPNIFKGKNVNNVILTKVKQIQNNPNATFGEIQEARNFISSLRDQDLVASGLNSKIIDEADNLLKQRMLQDPVLGTAFKNWNDRYAIVSKATEPSAKLVQKGEKVSSQVVSGAKLPMEWLTGNIRNASAGIANAFGSGNPSMEALGSNMNRGSTVQNLITGAGATGIPQLGMQSANTDMIQPAYDETNLKLPEYFQYSPAQTELGTQGMQDVVGQKQDTSGIVMQLLNQGYKAAEIKLLLESMGLGSGSGGKTLPAGSVSKLSDVAYSLEALGALRTKMEENKEQFDPLASSIKGALPEFIRNYDPGYTQVNAMIELANQVVGKAAEGGVLRKEDTEKYRKMLAQPTNTYEDALAKLSQVEDVIKKNLQLQIKNYANAGYDLSGFGITGNSSANDGIESNMDNLIQYQ